MCFLFFTKFYMRNVFQCWHAAFRLKITAEVCWPRPCPPFLWAAAPAAGRAGGWPRTAGRPGRTSRSSGIACVWPTHHLLSPLHLPVSATPCRLLPCKEQSLTDALRPSVTSMGAGDTDPLTSFKGPEDSPNALTHRGPAACVCESSASTRQPTGVPLPASGAQDVCVRTAFCVSAGAGRWCVCACAWPCRRAGQAQHRIVNLLTTFIFLLISVA